MLGQFFREFFWCDGIDKLFFFKKKLWLVDFDDKCCIL